MVVGHTPQTSGVNWYVLLELVAFSIRLWHDFLKIYLQLRFLLKLNSQSPCMFVGFAVNSIVAYGALM